jgi:hypothetical protein
MGICCYLQNYNKEFVDFGNISVGITDALEENAGKRKKRKAESLPLHSAFLPGLNYSALAATT